MHDIFNDEDLTDRINGLVKYKRTFILSPAQWGKLNLPNLTWDCIKFHSDNTEVIPDERGLYIFVLKYDCDFLPPHGYIMYLGITGDNNDRTLKNRYGEYVRELRRAKRYSIHEMLKKWHEHLYFYFLPISDRQISLSNYETMMLDALIPPYNEKDFSGDFGKIVKEAWR